MDDKKKTRAQLIAELEDLRKQKDEAKQSSMRQILYENNIIGIGISNEKGRILDANEAMLKMMGYSESELPDIQLADTYYNSDDLKEILKILKRDSKVEKYEVQLLNKEGRSYWASLSIISIKYKGENAYLTSMVDISERKKSEIELLKRSQFIETLFNNAPIGLALNEIDSGKVLFANETFRNAYKVPEESCRTVSDFFEYVYGDRMEIGQKFLDDVISGDPARMKWDNVPIIDKESGETNYISAENMILDNQNLMISTVQDITERRKAENSLKSSEKLLRTIAENIPNSYLSIIEKDYTIGYTAGQEFLKQGLDPKQFEGLHVEQIFANQYPIVRDNFEKVFMGKECSFEIFINNQHQLYRVIPLLSEDGSISRILSVAENITERKQLEEEQAKAGKLESIGLLAGGIAHDFNNILAAVLGNTSLAKFKLDSNSEEFGLLSEVEIATERATKLTQQLLTFAKGGAPVKEIIGLIELIKDTTQFSLRGSNVRYRTTFAPDLWAVEVDKGQISQVIGNLVINAQQAMPRGGTIKINAENIEVLSKNTLLLNEGNYGKISIVDEGIGIPGDQLSNIFDPYFTTKQKGSGLGLATVYSIIHRHNGRITVDSEVGTGTTFTVYLPASSKKVTRNVIIDKSEVLTGKILLMDDDKSVINVLSKMLINLGNEVDEAADGAEALRKYKKAIKSNKPFDVVVMDLTIPGGMGGKEAVQNLLKIDPGIKAIVSSGYGNDPAIANYKDFGFIRAISKPYKIVDLKQMLNEVLSGTQKS